tara:strand:+ start:1606 stop:2760 length:1155 start_codon:yes stop_codon:yes gene_type:complete
MNKKIAIITYARFPSEMAYGNHLIQIANSFVENGFNVSIYYPKTYNTKTIYERPEKYYEVKKRIEFKEINNFDITSYSIYNFLPSILKKIIYSLNTFIWSNKLKKYFSDESYVWSTNPNILLTVKKFFDITIYEKHGVARFIQKYSISRLKKDKNVYLIAVTKQSLNDLSKAINEPLYLPNGVDRDLFKPGVLKNEMIKIGYIGFLETYGIDKGVLSSVKEIAEINNKLTTNTLIVGGPQKKLDEITEYIEKINQKENFTIKDFVPHTKVPELISNLNIGIVPYPNEEHMSLYASPLKIFEFASCGVPVLLSNIKSHLELVELDLGLKFFQHDDFDDFRNKLESLILDHGLRTELSKKSLDNIDKLSWSSRTKEIITSVRSSNG